MQRIETATLAVLLAWSVVALTVTVVARAIARARVGDVRYAVSSARSTRTIFGSLLVALGGCALLVLEGGTLALALAALASAVAVLILAPVAEDQCYGARGVRRGWQARRFDELENWRLTGEHLRFDIHGVLAAVEIPESERETLRARLEHLRPDHQSPFRT